MYKSSGSLTDKLIDFGTWNVHHEMGLFDECLAAVDRSQVEFPSFEAKYCTVFFENQQQTNHSSSAELIDYTSNFVKSSIAFCIPSSCTAGDLSSAVAHRLHHQFNHFSLASVTSEDFCFTKDKIRSDSEFGIGGIITSYA